VGLSWTIITLVKNIAFDIQMPANKITTASSINIQLPHFPTRFYSHGWQSWSLAAWTNTQQAHPIQKPHMLHPMQIDPGYGHYARPHGSWVGAAGIDNKVFLLGSLSLDAHIALDGGELHGWYESGKGDWLIAQGDEPTVFSQYVNELGNRLGRKSNKPAPRVWCSWYGLNEAIDERILLKVLHEIGNLPFDVFQVDDGWQISVGEWESNSKFPSGMSALADRIKASGRKAGIWLAPLIAMKSSRLFREHPGWFLCDDRGKYVSAGFNWGEQLFALDTTHQAVLDWLTALMRQVRSWGYDYIKLDFLYGGALPGKRDEDMPREAAYRLGLKAIKEALGDNVYLLACGAPIIPSLGLCDALRIGTDVAEEWENNRDTKLLYNFTIPGTKNAIRAALNRLWLKPLVQVDPDVTYFRSMNCSLTMEQKSLLQDLALICNFKSTSDLPQWLTSNERDRLLAFLQTEPRVRQISSYIFEIDGRAVDFSEVVPLPHIPGPIDAIQGSILGWLANYHWILRAMRKQQMRTHARRMRRSLR
jgi:alpha-galactosidase